MGGWYRVVKTIKGHRYAYEQQTWREGAVFIGIGSSAADASLSFTVIPDTLPASN